MGQWAGDTDFLLEKGEMMMAYSNFPIGYQQQMYPQYFTPQLQQAQPQVVQQQTQVNDNGILWVQGEAGAKSWAVAPGKSVMLMDSESSTFYIKSSDNSGMPMPLRVFDYKERTVQQSQPQVAQHPDIDTSQFVTWDAFNKKLDELLTQKKEEVKIDG
jgi:hypothetical protein